MAKKHKETPPVKFDQLVKLIKYDSSLATYQQRDGKGWIYSIQILNKVTKDAANFCYDVNKEITTKLESTLFEVYGQRVYETYKDALQDGYGVLEYVGYVIQDKSKRSQFSVSSWDKKTESFIESLVFFDGFDFYNEP